MQSRRDLVQAYGFAAGRLGSALVSGNPGTGEIPMRRRGLGSTFGVVLAALLSAGFAVFGLIDPGGDTAWKQPGSLIVENETGNRYVYTDGTLRPVANYASALLFLGQNAVVRDVSRNSLAGVPHGPAIGINGAPDAVPSAQQLLTGPWTYCVQPDSPGDVVIDFAPEGHTTPLPAQRWVLLQAPDGSVYLLWDGRKYPITSRRNLIALGLDAVTPVAAPADWIDAIPTGIALAPAPVPKLGSPGPTVGGQPTRVGSLFHTVIDGSDHYYVVLADGLAPVSPTESALLAAGTSPAPVTVSPDAIAVAPASADQSLLNAVPDIVRRDASDPAGARLTTAGQALCLQQQMNGSATQSTLQSTLVRESGPAANPGSRVLVPPGRGLFATAAQSAATGAAPYLITDLGEKFLLGDSAAVQDLGAESGSVRELPPELLARVPTGPVLSTSAVTASVGRPPLTGAPDTRASETGAPVTGAQQ
ncbi:MAG TPA: type VII secretion protein EccB [Amycolatopsis sp.]|nr:type VII secretion protein EccB [Amycolatopsis sp.]